MHEFGGIYYAHHRYGFSEFANYSIYEGIFKCWQHSRDEGLKATFLRVVDWLIETSFRQKGF